MPPTFLAIQRCIMVSEAGEASLVLCDTADFLVAISEGHGDTAMVLLKAGAETDKKDIDGYLAIDLASDMKVGSAFQAFLNVISDFDTDPEVHRSERGA